MIKADPLITTQEVAEEFHTDHSTVAWHLNQIGKVKKLDKRVPHELTANQKILFWSVIFSYSMQQWTISWLDWNAMRILYDNHRRPAQLLDWEEAPKYFSEPS